MGKIIVDNVEYPNASALGIFDANTHTFSFAETAPAQGIGNVEFTYNGDKQELYMDVYHKIVNQKITEE